MDWIASEDEVLDAEMRHRVDDGKRFMGELRYRNRRKDLSIVTKVKTLRRTVIQIHDRYTEPGRERERETEWRNLLGKVD